MAEFPMCEDMGSNHPVWLITQNRIHSSRLDPWNSVSMSGEVQGAEGLLHTEGMVPRLCLLRGSGRALLCACLKGPHFPRRSVHPQAGLQVRPDGPEDTDADTHRHSHSKPGLSRLLKEQGEASALWGPPQGSPLPSGSPPPGRPNRMVRSPEPPAICSAPLQPAPPWGPPGLGR